jgi:hypothetical protein
MQIIAEEFHANNGKPATGKEAIDDTGTRQQSEP